MFIFLGLRFYSDSISDFQTVVGCIWIGWNLSPVQDWLDGSLGLGCFMGSTRTGDIFTVKYWSLIHEISIILNICSRQSWGCNGLCDYLIVCPCPCIFSIFWAYLGCCFCNQKRYVKSQKGHMKTWVWPCPLSDCSDWRVAFWIPK